MKFLSLLIASLVCFIAYPEDAPAPTETTETTETAAPEAPAPADEAPAADGDAEPTVLVEVTPTDFCQAHAEAILACDASPDTAFCVDNADAIADCVGEGDEDALDVADDEADGDTETD